MLMCLVGVIVWAGIAVLVGLLAQWAIKEIFGRDIPPRIVQVATFLVLFVTVVGLILCLVGEGPILPLPWARS